MSTAPDGENRPGREVAHRLFAAEFDDASLSYAESDEERAPNYVVTPTGARTNRVFVVGTLTEVTDVNEEMVRARVVDPTGAFVVYAGQYQPDQLAFLERAEPPLFVAVTGKARTFEPDDGDRVYTSIRPESIATVDAETRDRWVVGTAEHTLERIGTYAAAAELDARGEALTAALRENEVPERLATGVPLAQDHYGSTPDYLDALRTRAVQAVQTVAGDRDQVDRLDIGTDETGDGTATFTGLAASAGVSLADVDVPDSADEDPATSTADGRAAADEPGASGAAVGTATSSTTDATAGETAVDDAAIEGDDVGSTGDDVGSESGRAGTDGDDATADVDESEATGVSAETTESADADGSSGTNTDALGDFDGGSADTTADESVAETDDAGSDDLGDFDAGDATESADADATGSVEDPGDFDNDDLYELDEEERREVEEEFGTEFSTGTEVEEPGESDLESPEATTEGAVSEDTGADESTAVESEPEPEAEPASAESAENADAGSDAEPAESATDDEDDASDDDAAPEADDAAPEADDAAPAEDVDLQSYVVETMGDLDDGSGADRQELIDAVTADTGASADAVEDAIQDALMGGQCYEPDDDTLKAI